MKHSFTKQDLALFEDIGISSDDVAAQLILIEKKANTTSLVRAASAGDGIRVLTQKQMLDYAKLFDQEKGSFSMVRFIPASGLG